MGNDMIKPSLCQWRATWIQLGVTAPDEPLFYTLVARYAEPQRKYHTLQHLEECLNKLEELAAVAVHPAEVELALWFHDAIYEINRKDNEERSAQWASASVLEAGLSSEIAQRVYTLVMATDHKSTPVDKDAAIVVDVDLAILGASVERFDEYEAQVRQEYAAVPDLLFRRGRSQILQAFLARPRIYSTATFFERYEQQARANITRSLQRLAG
jgi:predicted metal-dependent HD superfamily phosphohydrolase